MDPIDTLSGQAQWWFLGFSSAFVVYAPVWFYRIIRGWLTDQPSDL